MMNNNKKKKKKTDLSEHFKASTDSQQFRDARSGGNEKQSW